MLHRIEPLEPRRLLAAGGLDPTFGGDGTVTTDLTGSVDSLAASVSVAMPDGRLLVAGQVRHAGGNDFALARFRADGSLDPSFGVGGRVITDVDDGSFDEIADADLLPNGKIIVAGTAGRSPYQGYSYDTDFVVARYNADGSLDAGFGAGGIVVTRIAVADDDRTAEGPGVAAAVALAPGGKLVVVGTTFIGGNHDVAVVRYLANGSLDTTFGGGDGIVTTNVYPESDDGEISPSDDDASDVYVHSDGRILVGGTARGEFLLVRYLPDGSIDPSFGRGHGPDYMPDPDPTEYGGGDPGDPGDGFVTTRFGGAAAMTDFAVWQGRIVAAGTVGVSWDGNTSDFAVARYNLNTGALDRGFSGDGKSTVDFAGARDEANSVLVRRDGTVFVAGVATMPNTLEDFAIARLDLRGRVVAGFGSGGRVTTDFGTAGGPTHDRAADASFAADGRIVLAGSATALPGGDYGMTGNRFGLARYFSNGALDRGFGIADRATMSFNGSLANYGADIAVQRDGRIVVAGNGNVTGGLADIILTRYRADGSLDPTFGGDGIVTTDLSAADDGRSTDWVYAIALDRYGRILVTGVTDRRSPGAVDPNGARRWDLFVARYWPSGALDRSFGNGAAFVVTDLGNGDDEAADIAVAPNGRIVIVGSTKAQGDMWRSYAVVRYLASGGLDPSFGGDGIVTTDLPGPIGEHPGGVAVQPDGRIVLAGVAWEPNTGQNFALLRYATDGSLDPTFGGGDGWLTTDFGGKDEARAVTLQADGRIVVAGEGQSNHARWFSDFAVARYLADGSLDTSFGNAGTGRSLLARDTADNTLDAANDVHVQQDGKVVLTGTTVHFPNAGPFGSGPGRGSFAAVRFNANGVIDADFGTGGIALVTFDGSSGAVGGGIDPTGRLVLAGGVFAHDGQIRPTGPDFAVARMLL